MTKPKQVKKKTLRKYWENFFRNYALFYMQGVGIFTEITVQFAKKILAPRGGAHVELGLVGHIEQHGMSSDG